eukprot:354318-Chlamydomonas_euryale.AAC.5
MALQVALRLRSLGSDGSVATWERNLQASPKPGAQLCMACTALQAHNMADADLNAAQLTQDTA